MFSEIEDEEVSNILTCENLLLRDDPAFKIFFYY